MQHEIDVASQKLDYELLNNRKQAIANTVKELLGKHQDPNLKKAYLDLVTDYANELTQPKCEKHGIPTQRKTHALTIDKISEIINTNQDWNAIAKVYDNVATIPGTETSVFFDYEHIFSPILKINCKNKTVTNYGFHHDENGILQSSELLEIINEISYEDGFYKYEWRIRGSNSKFKPSRFFPKHWTKLEVMDVINDALKKPIESPIFTSRFEIKGQAKSTSVLTYIEKNGKSITACPLVKNLKRL